MSRWSSPQEAEMLRLERELILLRSRVQATETVRLPALEQQMNLSWMSLGDIEFNNTTVKVPGCATRMQKTLYARWVGYMATKAVLTWDPVVSRWTGCGLIQQPAFSPFIVSWPCGTGPTPTTAAVVFQLDSSLTYLYYQYARCVVGPNSSLSAAPCPSSLAGVDVSTTPLFGSGTYINATQQGAPGNPARCAPPTDIRYISGNAHGDLVSGRGSSGIWISDVP